MRLIDADALIALISKRLKNPAIIRWLCSLVDETPTIEAKPVIHSEWDITDIDHAHGHRCYHCPECGWDEWRYESTRYCPNCGAKMEG